MGDQGTEVGKGGKEEMDVEDEGDEVDEVDEEREKVEMEEGDLGKEEKEEKEGGREVWGRQEEKEEGKEVWGKQEEKEEDKKGWEKVKEKEKQPILGMVRRSYKVGGSQEGSHSQVQRVGYLMESTWERSHSTMKGVQLGSKESSPGLCYHLIDIDSHNQIHQ